MKRIDDNTVALTNDELIDLRDFIRSALDSDWDRYTDSYICHESWEEGMRRMNEKMYDMAEQMGVI